MKLVTFAVPTPVGAMQRLGALVDGDETGRIVDLTTAYAAHLTAVGSALAQELAHVLTPPDMIGWLRGGAQSREAAEAALGFARERLDSPRDLIGAGGARLVFQRAEVHLLAPLPRPNSFRDFSIFELHMSTAGLPGHGAINRKGWYRYPVCYKGNCDMFLGPEDPAPFPYFTDKLDLEPEIGIVVGKTGRDLTVEEAKDAIAGYTLLIDCSARDRAAVAGGEQIEFLGPYKAKDFGTIIGPCLVTADEVDELNLKLKVSVDGETWYEDTTGSPRVWTAPMLVAYASDSETLRPGDLLGTGTVGLGCSMDLKKWPKPGQRFRYSVEGLGTLDHEVVAQPARVDYARNGMTGLLTYEGQLAKLKAAGVDPGGH